MREFSDITAEKDGVTGFDALRNAISVQAQRMPDRPNLLLRWLSLIPLRRCLHLSYPSAAGIFEHEGHINIQSTGRPPQTLLSLSTVNRVS